MVVKRSHEIVSAAAIVSKYLSPSCSHRTYRATVRRPARWRDSYFERASISAGNTLLTPRLGNVGIFHVMRAACDGINNRHINAAMHIIAAEKYGHQIVYTALTHLRRHRFYHAAALRLKRKLARYMTPSFHEDNAAPSPGCKYVYVYFLQLISSSALTALDASTA